MQRRFICGLLLFSALIPAPHAMAAGCDIGESENIARSAGYRIAVGAIKGAFIGGVTAAAAVTLVPALAPAGLLIFAGVTIATGILPTLHQTSKQSLEYLEASFSE